MFWKWLAIASTISITKILCISTINIDNKIVETLGLENLGIIIIFVGIILRKEAFKIIVTSYIKERGRIT